MGIGRSGLAIRDGALVLGQTAPNGGARSQIDLFEVLADAYLRGVHDVVVIENSEGGGLPDDLHRFNALLAARGMGRLHVRTAAGGTKLARKAQAILDEQHMVGGRRAMLGLQPDRGEPPEGGALARLQAMAADGDGVIFASVPVIDPERCTGCDACLRVCPHDALTQIKDETGASRYTSAPSTCDACGVCGDVCSFSAIRLEAMAKKPDDIPLVSWTCTACGVNVHAPERGGRRTGQCHICENNNVHRKLFQVLP
ncbi:4Fe-4S binding protein [Marimonas arenosa]|uniref:4Fe-4S binding protein n=1 Tax=Marimonas arenosa TaxID=1795305 RepID=A0AAE4B562_9RHOB|nr:4Fe-4S binding protein [Marimonas arenosa]MDQ2088926.1 4Fe-4S binding protein [Marimonas arenosa]